MIIQICSPEYLIILPLTYILTMLASDNGYISGNSQYTESTFGIISPFWDVH
jgi:hypothetical protein